MRIVAGITNAGVDLSLIKLPADALAFPAADGGFRWPTAVTTGFHEYAASLGWTLRFHDLRGSHSTILLDRGVPVHVVAARCGHDPAMLLRVYAKRTKRQMPNAANVIETLTAGALGRNWVEADGCSPDVPPASLK